MSDSAKYTQQTVGNNSHIIPGALVVRVARVQSLLVVILGGVTLLVRSHYSVDVLLSEILSVVMGACYLLLLIEVLSHLTYSILDRRTFAGLIWANTNLAVLGIGLWALGYLRSQPELIICFISSFATLLLLFALFLTLPRGS